jgi:hypothetical protein
MSPSRKAVTTATQVFVSYQRNDSRHAAGRLAADLVRELGHRNIFYDVHSVHYGVDFRQVIATTLSTIDVVVLVVGAAFDVGRLWRSEDYVRMELSEALQLDKPIIPVLIDETRMPAPHELPPELEELCYRNAARLRPDPDYEGDFQRLVGDIRASVGRTRPRVGPEKGAGGAHSLARIVASGRRAALALAGVVLAGLLAASLRNAGRAGVGPSHLGGTTTIAAMYVADTYPRAQVAATVPPPAGVAPPAEVVASDGAAPAAPGVARDAPSATTAPPSGPTTAPPSGPTTAPPSGPTTAPVGGTDSVPSLTTTTATSPSPIPAKLSPATSPVSSAVTVTDPATDPASGTSTAPTPSDTPSRSAPPPSTVAAPLSLTLATVVGTCGLDGPSDCRLPERPSPANGVDPPMARFDEGATIGFVCQVPGEAAFSPVLGASGDVWARLPDGGYVANVYLRGSGIDPLRLTIPC